MNKKKSVKQNRYKSSGKNLGKDLIAIRADSDAGINFCIKGIMTAVLISILSLAAIFIHDFVTQSETFGIKAIKISGTKRVLKKDIIELANLNYGENIFKLNLGHLEKLIASHPWIRSVKTKRYLPCDLSISIVEQEPIAIVQVENMTDLLINTQGIPFKEYNPQKDHIADLPVILGIDLTKVNNQFIFNSTLFDSVMDFLKTGEPGTIQQIQGDRNTGITVKVQDIYNQLPLEKTKSVKIKLGFDNFKAKLAKAKYLSKRMGKEHPKRTIYSMDLFNIKKVFIKTEPEDA